MKKVTVVAAVIQDHDNFLCVQRGPNKYPYISKKWEFPGGKIEANETEQEALIRELKEELHLDLTVNEKLITVNHDYNDFSLTMHTYLCSTPNRELTLTEHINYKWLKVDQLEQLDWAAADIPIVNKLKPINGD